MRQGGVRKEGRGEREYILTDSRIDGWITPVHLVLVFYFINQDHILSESTFLRLLQVGSQVCRLSKAGKFGRKVLFPLILVALWDGPQRCGEEGLEGRLFRESPEVFQGHPPGLLRQQQILVLRILRCCARERDRERVSEWVFGGVGRREQGGEGVFRGGDTH